MVYGSRGLIAWFYAIIYMGVAKRCTNIYVRVIVHSIGLFMIIYGFFLLITTMPSLTSIGGIFLIMGGVVIFLLPFNPKE